MYMTAEVFFDIYGDVFYMWNTRDGHLEQRSHTKRDQIWVKADGKMKRARDIERDVHRFCARFAQTTRNPYYLDKKTYELTLHRMLHIKDEADTKYYQSHNFNGECIKFILIPDGNLIYPADIRDALKVPHYFKDIITNNPDNAALDNNTPVFIEKYDRRFATVRNITPADRVLDTHGRYLWAPDENLIGQKCPDITELLKQRREKVYGK